MTDVACPPESPQPGKRLGKMPARGDVRLLHFANFVQLDKLPKCYNPWTKRAPFEPRTFGNRSNGCCTRASQALHHLRLERVETRRTPVVTDEEVLRVYYAMTERLYGGGDTGAYEIDALGEWRDPNRTFKDDKGRPLCIDAFTAVNHRDADEVKAAICLSGKFGVKLCLNLPTAFSRIDPPQPWDVPQGQSLIGDWTPGSWGGHSLYADSYDADGVRLVHSWYEGSGLPKEEWPLDEQTLTWRGLAAYCDEMYFVVDSVDAWRKRSSAKFAAALDLAGIVKAVRKVSDTPPASLA